MTPKVIPTLGAGWNPMELNTTSTSVAGLKLASPAWDARSLTRPVPVKFTVDPEKVTKPDTRLTVIGRFDVVVGLIVKDVPEFLLPGLENVIVWLALLIVQFATDEPVKLIPVAVSVMEYGPALVADVVPLTV